MSLLLLLKSKDGGGPAPSFIVSWAARPQTFTGNGLISMYPRNNASPEPIALGAVVQISDGAVQTSGVTVRIKPKGVAEGDGGGTTSYSTNGVVYYTPTQAETNYSSFILIASKTGCIPVEKTIVTSDVATSGQVKLEGVTHTGATIPTVTTTTTATNLTNLPSIPANWITSAGIDAGALNGKGDWNIGKTGYALSASGLASVTAWTVNITGSLSGSVGSVTGPVGSVTSAVTVGTINANTITNTAFAIGAITANTFATGALTAAALASDAAAEISDAVWDEVISGHLTAGTTGAALNAAGGAGDPWATLLPGAYGAGTAGKIIGDNINATISSRATQTSVDTVDTVVDQIKVDTTNTLSRLPAALVSGRMDSYVGAMANNVITATVLDATAGGEIADAVWDEAISGHLGVGSTGAALNAAGSAGDPWSTLLPGAYGAGTAGKIVGDNLNATVSSRATQTTADAIETDTQNIQSRLPAALVSGRIDAYVGATGSGVITSGTFATNAITATVIADSAIDAGALAADAADEIAHKVWEELLSGHMTNGTTGKALYDAAAGGADPWATLLPGAYGAGTAGFILGTNLDEPVSTVAAGVWAEPGRTLDGTQGANLLALGSGVVLTGAAENDLVEAVNNEIDLRHGVGSYLPVVLNNQEVRNAQRLAASPGVPVVLNSIDDLLIKLNSVMAGISSMADWLRVMARKDAGTAGMATAATEMGGTYTRTNDSLEAIRDRGDAAWTTSGGGTGSGSGQYPITFTVRDLTSNTLLNQFKVTALQNDSIVAFENILDGNAILSLDPGDYTILIYPGRGYSPINPQSLTVAGTASVEYSTTAVSPTPPASPGLCTVQAWFVDAEGAPKENVRLSAEMVDKNSVANNAIVILQKTVGVSDASGYVELQLIRLDQFKVGKSGEYRFIAYDEEGKLLDAVASIPNSDSATLGSFV